MLSSGLLSCQLHSTTFVLMFLMFMIIHLFQFRFADTEQYFLAFLHAVTGIRRKIRPARPVSTCCHDSLTRKWRN